MAPTTIPQQVTVILLLFLAALAAALIARRFQIPYTLVLVFAGLLAGVTRVAPGLSLQPEVVLFVFLPALLFQGAWEINVQALRRDALIIALLAVPGLLLALVIAAGFLVVGAGLDWPTALLLGAIISPTDPIVALEMFRSLGLPERLNIILEGESLFNDGVGVTVFALMLPFTVEHIPIPPPFVVGAQGVWLFAGGPLIGAAVGLLATLGLHRTPDHLVETGITFVAAYSAFLIGQSLETSGLLAVITAGLVAGTVGRRTGLSKRGHVAVDEVWEFTGFVANSLLFLLLGVEIGHADLLQTVRASVVAVIGIFVGRAIMVWLSAWLHQWLADTGRSKSAPLPTSWRGVMIFSGLRGALSLALALSLPDDTADLGLIRGAVFGVVLVTLLVQGLGLKLIIPRLLARIHPA